MEAAAVLRWQRLLAQLIFSEPVTEIENCVYSAAGQRARWVGLVLAGNGQLEHGACVGWELDWLGMGPT